MAKGSEGFVLCLNWGYLTFLVLIKLNLKFKLVNAINDCVEYRYSHLRGSIRSWLTQLPRITLIAFKSRLILFSLFKDLKCPRYLC